MSVRAREPLVGVVRVVSMADPTALAAHGRVLEKRYGLTTRSHCLPGQPHGVHDAETYRAAAPKVVAAARTLRAEGADAVVISCAADPGLSAARAAVDVAVIGAGSAGAAVASALGDRVGVLGITDDAPAAVRQELGDHLCAVARPDAVRRTTDLAKPGATQAVVDAARRLVYDDGAEVVLLACTGLTTHGLAEPVRIACRVPVVDAVLAAGLVTYYTLGDTTTTTRAAGVVS